LVSFLFAFLFYSRCPHAQPFVQVGARTCPRALWKLNIAEYSICIHRHSYEAMSWHVFTTFRCHSFSYSHFMLTTATSIVLHCQYSSDATVGATCTLSRPKAVIRVPNSTQLNSHLVSSITLPFPFPYRFRNCFRNRRPGYGKTEKQN